MKRAVVIGGGLSGLGAALILSRLNHQVILLEKSNLAAPLVRGFYRGGLHYETGFHYAGGLAQGQVLHRYLDRLGLFKAGLKTRPLAEPGGETLRFSDADFQIPGRYQDFREMMPKRPELDSFFDRSFSFFKKSPFLNPEGGLEAGDIYRAGPSLAEALDSLPLTGRWKNIMGCRRLLYGLAPSEASFGEFALVNVPYLSGGHSFEGGGALLAKAFEESARSSGVELLLGREVTALKTTADNRIRAVEIEANNLRDELVADCCVYTGSPAALPRLLPDKALRPVLARRLASIAETPRPFMIFGHSGSSRLADRQLFVCPDGDLEDWLTPERNLMYLSGGSGRQGRWPISVVSLMTDESPFARAYPGRPSQTVGTEEYLDFKAKRSEELRRHLLASCPELENDFEVVDCATDRTFGRYSYNFGRGIYGRKHGLNDPPILPVTRVGGLALAGQNIVMPGLLGVLVSAALAVSCLVGLDEVLEVIR